MTNKTNPRLSNSSRRISLRNRVASLGLPCAICGAPIDYTRPHDPRDPWCYELHEKTPISRGGSPVDPANCVAVHRICNERQGNKLPSETQKTTAASLPISQDWRS